MLGEMLGESRGKRTGRRVLPMDGPGVKVEVAFEDSGKLLGIDMNNIGTYWSATRPDGTLYGEGQGVIVTRDGDMGTWKGAGIGQLKGGAVSYRGAIFYYSASPKLARLNSIAAVFEFAVDPEGNTHTKLWEWK
ncbi:MAG TPA: hypothetical protein VFA54_04495 [Bryobacterales bacterium]|jgi:hypothetical protein|nr:hypothetical protein [Bryobacterales bacterium]